MKILTVLVKVRNLPVLQKVLLFTIIVVIICIIYTTTNGSRRKTNYDEEKERPPFPHRTLSQIIRHGLIQIDSIHVIISACGDSPDFLDKSLVMVKSTVTLTRSHVHFIILTDFMGYLLHNAMQEWPDHIQSRFSYEIRPIEYPGINKADLQEWKYMFSACSTQRLFIPTLFPDLDSVLYIDADTLFLDDIRHLWEHFSKFDDEQLAGIAEEFYHPTKSIGFGYWEKWGEGDKPPIVGRSGVNAGVILMNLTRMRDFDWQERILPIYRDYRNTLYADQGIINLIFHYNMDKLYKLPCRWNYWYDYCKYGECCVCESAEESGIGLLHHTGFKWDHGREIHSAIFGPYLNYNFESNLTTHFVLPLKKILNTRKGSSNNCFDNPQVITLALERVVKELQK